MNYSQSELTKFSEFHISEFHFFEFIVLVGCNLELLIILSTCLNYDVSSNPVVNQTNNIIK